MTGDIPASSRSWFVERWIVGKSKNGFSNHRQYVIVVIVPHIERQVSINAFQHTGAIQAARSTGANAMLNCLFGQVLNYVSRATARKLGLLVPSCLPQSRNMP